MGQNQSPHLKMPPIFYGWVVVACAFVILFVAFGSFYSFTTFFESLQIEFNTSRSTTSLVFAIAGFILFSLGVVSGQISDRIGSRWVIAFGVLVIGTGLLLASRATTIRQIYVVYGAGIGIGVGFVYVPAVGVVQRWFVRKRGTASGLAVTGIGLGTLCMPLFSAFLIHWNDWRTAYFVMSILVLSGGLCAALLIVESPAQRGLMPDGDTARANSIVTSPDMLTSEALKTRPFWLLYAAAFSSSLGLFIPFVHMVPFTKDLGLPTSTGVMLFSLIGIGSTVGRFFIGHIADSFGRRQTLAGMFGGLAAMFAWWLVSDSVWELAIFTFLFGACYGGFVALMPAVTADYFSGRNIIGIIGALYTSVAVGTLIGPTLAGLLYDLQQSYTIPILASIIVMLISAFCAALLKQPDEWRRCLQTTPADAQR
jgi:MFS family permease